MSKLACHVIKCKSSDVRGMEIHNERESAHSKNPDIDHSRTKDNYDALNIENTKYLQKVKEITGEMKTRKDAIKMVSVMVTAEKSYFDGLGKDETRRFFETSAKYLADRFGKENIVAAKVHLDEKTPHMHFAFVPMTEDKRLCAKEIITRKGLRELQDELPKSLQKNGFIIDRGEALSTAKHLDTNDFKREQLKQEQAKLDQDLAKIEGVRKALQAYDADKQKEFIDKAIQSVKQEKKFGLLDTGNVTLPKNHWNNICILARSAVDAVMKQENNSKKHLEALETLKTDKKILEARLELFNPLEKAMKHIQIQNKKQLLQDINAFAMIKAEEIQKRQIIERETKMKSLKISKTQEFSQSRGR